MHLENADDVLVKQFQNGDTKAFDLLVIKYQSRVQAVIARFLRSDLASVEDIAQESFIKAYKALGKFRGDSQFYTWLFRIAVNTAKNHLTSSHYKNHAQDTSIDEEDFYSEDDMLQSNETPESEFELSQMEAKLRHTLDNLPEDLRNAISLRELSGMSYEDIAEVMDCPVGTVRSRIFRARSMLNESFQKLQSGQ